MVIAIFLYYVGMILRFIPNSQCFLAARIILSIDIIVWFVKSLKAYWFIRKLGPLLVMIERMTWHLFYFMILVILFMFAFGVSTQALMYPNQNLDKDLLKSVFFPSFFVIFKEYYTRKEIMDGKFFLFCFSI